MNKTGNDMIPKKIHYCWFGGDNLPELAIKCIESWKKFCPDYEIIEWNESNFDINCNDYVREAYNAKKWAFVSDYARFKIIYDCGGIYFDTDVELIKSLDNIIKKGPFMGCEAQNLRASRIALAANPGLALAANPGLPLIKTILDCYDNSHFINPDGSQNLKTVVNRTTEILEKYGFNKYNTGIQFIDGIYIYPQEYFCPLNYRTGELDITSNTVAIHHYVASWQDKKERKYHRITQKMRKVFGEKWGSRLSIAVIFPFRVGNKFIELGPYEFIKYCGFNIKKGFINNSNR